MSGSIVICPAHGCPGDGRYAPPGRGHIHLHDARLIDTRPSLAEAMAKVCSQHQEDRAAARPADPDRDGEVDGCDHDMQPFTYEAPRTGGGPTQTMHAWSCSKCGVEADG